MEVRFAYDGCPRPLEHESPLNPTRPGLLSKQSYCEQRMILVLSLLRKIMDLAQRVFLKKQRNLIWNLNCEDNWSLILTKSDWQVDWNEAKIFILISVNRIHLQGRWYLLFISIWFDALRVFNVRRKKVVVIKKNCCYDFSKAKCWVCNQWLVAYF